MTGDDEDPFITAFDRRENDRITSDLDMTFRRVGLLSDPAGPERQRVALIIDRDRRYTARENARKLAELEVREGVYVNIAESVVEPTPEWLNKGDTRTFWPKQHDRTTRAFATVRRVVTPVVLRMHHAGKLSADQAAACLWYRDRHETAGLDGRYKSSNISLAGNTGGGGGGGGQAPMAVHEFEAQARAEFRAARATLPTQLLRLFDAVVLNDVPVSRAWRFVRGPRAKAEARMRQAAEALVRHLNATKPASRDDRDADD